ncbi:MAG: hypothetical protein ACM3U2_11640 [Deltaproteobacteria bacterium]
MKQLVLSVAAIMGLGLLATSSTWARGPAGGMGFGALAGTSNPPRAGRVAAPYGLYSSRPYNPGLTYGPAIRAFPPSATFPPRPIPQGTFPYRTVPRTNPVNPFGGPSYYYFRR